MNDYRDKLGTVAGDGRRIWVYPVFVRGWFQKRRKWTAYALLFMLFVGPWIRINGNPLLQLNLPDREFVILGRLFFAQDTFLFAWAMLTFFIAIILTTVVFGRVFCGWVCPQTIFLEFVFRPIERWIEGNPNEQRRRDAAPWTWDKIWRKGLKALSFFSVSFAIANTFLAYIIGSDALLEIQFDDPQNHLPGLLSLIIFTAVFYFVFAYMREQVCSAVCPYGRLQGVLVDDDTVNVSYDANRGEPRGRLLRGVNQIDQGDCIDCRLCVRVCPTGIDIRNGLQLECIHCTACIDACDEIMQKVDRPAGLIRYASNANLQTGKPFRLTRKALSYMGVNLFMIFVFLMLLIMRQPVELNVFRAAGVLPKINASGEVVNLFSYSLLNKTNDTLRLSLGTSDVDYTFEPVGTGLMVIEPRGRSEGVFLMTSFETEGPPRNPIQFQVMCEERVYGTAVSSFARPMAQTGRQFQ